MIHTQDYYYIIYNHGKIVIDISLDIKYIIILWARKMEYLHYCYYYCQHYFLHQLLLLLQNLHNCCCCSFLIWWSRILVNNICLQNSLHHSNILHMTCSCSYSGFFWLHRRHSFYLNIFQFWKEMRLYSLYLLCMCSENYFRWFFAFNELLFIPLCYQRRGQMKDEVKLWEKQVQ